MIEIQARLDELSVLGQRRRTRMVSGPQGPRVLLDGKPVLLLCSDNQLGLADHPRVRQAAADAATRWGVGAGASRLASGMMTIHRRLEEGLADFHGRERAVVFGSDYLAAVGTIGALARPGDVVFADELCPAAVGDACVLSGAEVFAYDHGDVEHLGWGLTRSERRGALIVTDGLFVDDGDLAPLAEIVELAQRHGVRTVVGESHGVGALGPGGRGALAAAGLEDQVDVLVGSLATAFGADGAYVACDRRMAAFLVNAARTLVLCAAPAPPTVAAALAALELVRERPQMARRLAANGAALRDALGAEGFATGASLHHILPVHVGDGRQAARLADEALARGVFVQAIRPPDVPPTSSRLRLTVMATHREAELRAAARTLAAAARAAGADPRSSVAPASAGWEDTPSDDEPDAVAPPWPDAADHGGPVPRVFDFEADEPIRRAA